MTLMRRYGATAAVLCWLVLAMCCSALAQRESVPAGNAGATTASSGPLPDGAEKCWLPVGGGNLICRLPGGWVVPIEGTTTQGLEEGIRAACDHNLSMDIDGSQALPGGKPGGVLFASTPIDFRNLRAADGSRAPCPIQGKTLRWRWFTLDWNTTLHAHGFVLDSIMQLHFIWDGQLVYNGDAEHCAFALIPTNPVPIDKFVSAVDSKIFIGHLAAQGKGSSPLCMALWDSTKGGIVNVDFEWSEINGGGCPDCANVGRNGIILRAEPTSGIVGNHLKGRVHGFTGAGLDCGTTGGAAIFGNTFDIGFYAGGKSSVGIDLGCGRPRHGNLFNAMFSGTELKSNDFTAVKFEPGAAGNIFLIPYNDAETPYVDVGDGAMQGNTIIGGAPPAATTRQGPAGDRAKSRRPGG